MKMTLCVACGDREPGNLEHHHLVPRSEGGSDDDSNLITLCHGCHGKAHGMIRRDVRKLIKSALSATKARGTKLGGDRGNFAAIADAGRVEARKARTVKANARAADFVDVIADIRAGGASSLREIASELNARQFTTPRGGQWSAVQVDRLLARMPA